MASRCSMASLLCVLLTSWFVGFGAMAVCMITLDQSVTGTYFWNYVKPDSNEAQTISADEIKAKTITDTQLISRIVLFVGGSSIISVFLSWIFAIRQINSDKQMESECKVNRFKVNALSDHITDGKHRVIVDNMDDLISFLVDVKAGNDRCEQLLNHWHRSYLRCQAYYAYTASQRSEELHHILLELLEGYRSQNSNISRPAIQETRLVTLV